MRIIIIGSQPVGWVCFKKLLERGQEVVGAITFNPPPYEKWEHSIDEIAKEKNIQLIYCDNLNSDEMIKKIKELNPDLMIVVGWRQLIKKEIFSIPKFGTVALHASLLPELRGFAPLNWAIINGKGETGITMFYIDEGIDTGDIVGQKKVSIEETDDIVSLKKKVEDAAVQCIEEYVPLIERETAPRIKQDHTKATYGRARKPDDSSINWNERTSRLYNFIRALTPPYAAFTFYNGQKVFVLKVSAHENSEYYGKPGEIVARLEGKGVAVITGDGTILLEKIQPENSDEMEAYNYFTDINKVLGK